MCCASNSGITRLLTFIPLLQLLLVKVSGLLKVEKLLLGELALAVGVMHC